ncbi:unnamed protein product [Psylliodes chrysocephalus]|uniref:Uncharacterized protein n=1 Tax=Psylliodes chrysocephalus TaxID=3402493 RepID=A0A9P0CVG6_9CUCU|nr:unnamed protein product [Psylliodes chrysocephala]
MGGRGVPAPISIVELDDILTPNQIRDEQIKLVTLGVPENLDAIKWLAKRRLLRNTTVCQVCQEATLLETSRTIDVHKVKKGNGYFKQEEEKKKEVQNSGTTEEVRCSFCNKSKHDFKNYKYRKFIRKNAIKKGICKKSERNFYVEIEEQQSLEIFNLNSVNVNYVEANMCPITNKWETFYIRSRYGCRVENIAKSLKSNITPQPDMRGRHLNRPKKIPENVVRTIDDHISFPRRSSDYSRGKNDGRYYLPAELNADDEQMNQLKSLINEDNLPTENALDQDFVTESEVDLVVKSSGLMPPTEHIIADSDTENSEPNKKRDDDYKRETGVGFSLSVYAILK